MPPVRLLGVLWICFVLRATFYAAVTPLWEGFDEWAHFGFVQHLATRTGLPRAAHDRVSVEIDRSLKLLPLPWALKEYPHPHVTHDAWWTLPPGQRSERQQEMRRLPPDRAQQTAQHGLLVYEALQPPLYYWPMSWVHRLLQARPLAERVLLIRWLGVLLASCVVPLSFMVARQVLGDDRVAVSVAALVVVMPELMINVARVSNEALGVPLLSALTVAVLRVVERPVVMRRWALAGVLLGAGLITKAYFLTTVAALLPTGLSVLVVERAGRRKVAAGIGLAGTLAAALSLWWYLRNRALTGTWSGLSEAEMLREVTLPGVLRRVPDVDWRNALDSILFSHIFFGGWSGLMVRSWMYHLLYLVVAAAIVGVLLLLVRAIRQERAPNRNVTRLRALLVLLAIYGAFWLGQAYNVLLLFLSKGASTSMGWYMYCVVAAEATLLVAGLRALPISRLRPRMAALVASLLALLDLYALHFLLIPYYTGLIRHNEGGRLASFKVQQLHAVGVPEILSRLAVNKPDLLSEAAMGVLWLLFLAATLTAVLIAFAMGRTPSPASPART